MSELTNQNAAHNSAVLRFSLCCNKDSLNADSIPARVKRDCELCAPGDGEVRFGAPLHGDVFDVRAVFHVPENSAGGSADLHLLCSG